ncbi:MAG: DUF1638 domain-containing protein [Actinobacteria bacterium]|nr:DUF1638 domain-containing protein [Chloroflexota bacterium]MCL5292213.1 DUF1638 domain-containing protein [Actinomycetota bacterium]
MKIGVVACDMIKRELDKVITAAPDITDVVYLEGALHVYPQKMKETIKSKLDAMKDKVDIVFLGFGYCQSLKGIEAEVDVPVVMPQVDDCISILLTPERYAEEIRKEVGTWFMTPGWAEVGADMVIKELHLDRALKYGKDPLEMAKRLFTHYRRGLFIDTGVGNEEYFVGKAEQFCGVFNLTLEETTAESTILAETLEKCRRMAPGSQK